MTDNEARTEERRLPRVKPATDIIEREDGFYIYVDMPGVAKSELVIDLNEDELKVSGKAEYALPEGQKLGHVEFGGGEYFRSFTVSHIVDKEKIKATLKDGVLELYLPRLERVQPRKIEIQAG
ncbi:heat shock protein Hsp20 [Solidesulfovibrio carbinoliphilus subsp. oakridgensis]|uniref:Heat shock protein Hsp20 n=1 Tax=Solidesulfovibrio carbinoliphilus subsp. oakridgensis TaxID=694327 RepID=G7Q9Y7_9BACT|nr:Hsp20/alpha crystallin family protein [Solidesulfovibrio carbinoliphilus]EHJ47817.1 heat shock protein Hsp20 [Solidesulfovibrio carbinoliphilus subsp. oakridgensis]